ncbi:MAG: phosphoribosylglycinamide formyltransferase [Myxococcales bacterium]|nr:phosphoribosylglycinamide formyltransferase [Myxococcales bacterium]
MSLPIAVLISGTGSNLKAILQAIEAGRCDARVAAVLSDRSKAKGLELARERRIPTEVVRLKAYEDRGAWDAALAERVASFDPGLVVLAGFMKIVGPAMIAAFPSRIVNVHPALLPSFPGTDGPGDAVAAGVRVSGCTVHVVDAGVDTGPILAQAAVPVLPGDDRDALHARIQRLEHRLLPGVVHAVASGALELSDPPRWRDAPGADAELLYPAPQ